MPPRQQHSILVLGPESWGGLGGIAQGTRDYLGAIAASASVEHLTLLARKPPHTSIERPESIAEEACPGAPWRYAKRVWQLARSRRFDGVIALHVNLMPLAAMLARASCLPTWLFLHGIDAWAPPGGLRTWAAKKASLATASSRITRDRFLDWSKLDSNRARVLHNPVDLDRFTPGPRPLELVERYGLAGKRALLTLGQLRGGNRGKGHDEITTVLPRLLERHPDLVWLVVGDGPDRARIEQRVQTAGLADHVRFAGTIREEEKLAHYRVADAFALAGTTEGLGIVYLEALATGLPVLGSALDGSRDALRDGELGTLVDPTNPQALCAGLEELCKRPKSVPAGLEHFSYRNLLTRVDELLSTWPKKRRSAAPAPDSTSRRHAA